MSDDIREQLAALAHNDQWSGWAQWMIDLGTENPDGSVTISAEHIARWRRQIRTPYVELTEEEKATDREEADKMLAIIGIMDGE